MADTHDDRPVTTQGHTPGTVSTERFVEDLGEAVASLGRPVTLVGHSMGGLHSWCLAAERLDLDFHIGLPASEDERVAHIVRGKGVLGAVETLRERRGEVDAWAGVLASV